MNDELDVKHYFKAMSGSTEPDDNQHVSCACGWTGTILDTNRAKHRAGELLSQREGYVWQCPRCGEHLWYYWYMVS